MKPTYLLLGLCLFPISASFSQSLQDTLSEEEFQAAGLQKLSEKELAFLNQLLERDEPPAPEVTHLLSNSVETEPTISRKKKIQKKLPPVENEDLVGKEQLEVVIKSAPKKVESRLVGEFDGWNGDTTFTLENGQIWKQRIDDVQKYSLSHSPKVTVKKGFGGYRLHIEGYRQSCPVKRVK